MRGDEKQNKKTSYGTDYPVRPYIPKYVGKVNRQSNVQTTDIIDKLSSATTATKVGENVTIGKLSSTTSI